MNPECVEYVYELFDGHTWFIQYVFNRLYEMTEKGSAVTIEQSHEALRPLIKDETVSYVNGHYLISNRFFSLWLAGRY